jgi:hypothetical protein
MGLTIKKTVNVDNTTKIQEIIKELNSYKIQIGIFGKDDSFMLMIAAVNEFGTTIVPKNAKALTVPMCREAYGHSAREIPGLFIKKSGQNAYLCKKEGNGLKYYYWLAPKVVIPSRPFIRGTYNEKQSDIQKFIDESLAMVFSFKIDVRTFFNRVGQYLTQLTQMYLTDLKEPAKSQITITANGGKENPLIDSGRMRESITWQLVAV